MSSANCCVWDFTIKKEGNDQEDIKNILVTHCKKWAFQLEKGSTGYEHFQGRINLKCKKRKNALVKLLNNKDFHISLTSSANKNNNFYVMKTDTQIDGPWTNEDTTKVMTRQLKGIKKLKPFQKSIIEMSQIPDDRRIDVIINHKGNLGKTLLAEYMEYHDYGSLIPFCNDYKDILRMVYCMPNSKSYMIDMPRCSKKDKLFQMFGAVETIKQGYTYDDRYSFKKRWFDRPRIFIFTNDPPDQSFLSRDMWKFWTINDKNELVTYNPNEYGFYDNNKINNKNNKNITDYFEDINNESDNDIIDDLDIGIDLIENTNLNNIIPTINIINNSIFEDNKQIPINKSIKKIQVKKLIKKIQVKKLIKKIQVKKLIKKIQVNKPIKKIQVKKPIKKIQVKKPIKKIQVKKPIKKIPIKKPIKKIPVKKPINYKNKIKYIKNQLLYKMTNDSYVKLLKKIIIQLRNNGIEPKEKDIYLKLFKIQKENLNKKYIPYNINELYQQENDIYEVFDDYGFTNMN